MPEVKHVFLFPIPDFAGYWATPDGRIYSTRPAGRGRPRKEPLEKKQRPHPKKGHLRTDLFDAEGVKHTIGVHQLVAWTFLGPQPAGMLVCHKNGVETDNDYTNLYYGTDEDNRRDRIRHECERGGQDPLAGVAPEHAAGEPLEGECFDDPDEDIEYVPDEELGF